MTITIARIVTVVIVIVVVVVVIVVVVIVVVVVETTMMMQRIERSNDDFNDGESYCTTNRRKPVGTISPRVLGKRLHRSKRPRVIFTVTTVRALRRLRT